MAPDEKKIHPAQPPAREAAKARPQPLSEGPMGRPYSPAMAREGCPDLPLELASDAWTSHAFFQMGRMGMDNFDNLGEYVAAITELFESCRRCTVFFSPSDIFDSMKTSLEHRLTVRRGGGTVTIDESGRDSWGGPFDPILSAFMNRAPVLLDRNPGGGMESGLRLVFEDLDRKSDRGVVQLAELDPHLGMRAIMPFYYREPDNPSGVVLMEGDLRARGSSLEGFSKAYWGAALAMNATSQISLQLVHRFDSITKLPRRLDFEIDLKEGIRELIRQRSGQLHLMFIDLDNFKSINDEYTHPVGDEVLRQAAEMLQASVRADDSVGRLGGEEFGVLVGGIPYGTALQIAERIRMNVESIRVYISRREDGGIEILKPERYGPIPEDAEAVRVTCSIGVTDVSAATTALNLPGLPPNGRGDRVVQDILDSAYGKSTEMLHRAKAGGKNRIYFSDGTRCWEYSAAV